MNKKTIFQKHYKAYKIYMYIVDNNCTHDMAAKHFNVTRNVLERLLNYLSEDKQQELKEISFQLQKISKEAYVYRSRYY